MICKDTLARFMAYIPFLLMTTLPGLPGSLPDGTRVSVNFMRLAEAMIMAVLGGALSGYITLQVLKDDVQQLKTQLQVNNTENKNAMLRLQDLILNHIIATSGGKSP